MGAYAATKSALREERIDIPRGPERRELVEPRAV